MQRAERRQQIEAHAIAGEAAVAVRGVVAPCDARPPQRAPHLLPAEPEQRPDAPVAVRRGQGRERRAAGRRGQAVEDRLDAIIARMPGRDRPPCAHGVCGRAPSESSTRLRAGTVSDRSIDLAVRDAEPRGQCAAGLGVGGALGAPQPVRDVQRLERMAERVQGMGEQRRVGAARDEGEHGLARREQPRARDRRADAPDQVVVERHGAAIRPA